MWSYGTYFFRIFTPWPSATILCFSGWPSAAFVCSSGQIWLPRYFMNGSSNLDETYREYSQAPTDDLIRVWRSNVIGQGHRRLSRWRSIILAGPFFQESPGGRRNDKASSWFFLAGVTGLNTLQCLDIFGWVVGTQPIKSGPLISSGFKQERIGQPIVQEFLTFCFKILKIGLCIMD